MIVVMLLPKASGKPNLNNGEVDVMNEVGVMNMNDSLLHLGLVKLNKLVSADDVGVTLPDLVVSQLDQNMPSNTDDVVVSLLNLNPS